MIKAIATLIAVTVSVLVLGVGTAKADTCYENCWQNGNTYQCNTYCN
jgi:hypothetical protein